MDLCWQSNVSNFNILSRLVITFLPRSKCLLISWLQSLSTVILEPPKIINPTNKLNLHFDPFFRESLPTEPPPVFLSFPGGSNGKESTCNAGDLGSIPGLGRFPGEGKGYPLQYSGLENSMYCIVHGVTKSQTWLSDFHFHDPAILPLRVYSEEVKSLNWKKYLGLP